MLHLGLLAILAPNPAAMSMEPAAVPFNYIRIGDIDGMGFMTGTDPCGTELCWPFNSPWSYVQGDLGACSGFQLLNAVGSPINVDGVGILEAGDFLPDLDCSHYGNGGTHTNSDEFDNRTPIEIAGPPEGGYVEVDGATNYGSEGSGWTDVAVCGTGSGWSGCVLTPSSTPYICGQGQPTFHFDFDAASADPSQPLYINAIMGDYDVTSGADQVKYTTLDGSVYYVTLTAQDNSAGEDGLIQEVTATIPFADVFPYWSSGNHTGGLDVEFQFPNEPFLTYDYVEIAIAPLVVLEGCCCFFNPESGNWELGPMTDLECLELGGYFTPGDDCDPVSLVIGACCYLDSGVEQCIDTAECECQDIGGIFHAGTLCIDLADGCFPETGCCCVEHEPGTWVYIHVTQQQCDDAGGWYFGDGVQCEGETPPEGACCFDDGTGQQCIWTNECHCLTLSGNFYQGYTCTDIASKCPGGDDPEGCCCYNSGGTWVQSIMTETQCDGLAGWYYGDGTECEGDVPYGACCMSEGGSTWCFETWECKCLLGGGWFFPNVTCNEIDCEGDPQEGACCYIDLDTGCESCLVTTITDCENNHLSGVFQGVGTACTDPDVTCCQVIGACCHGDGCIATTLPLCTSAGGVWIGGLCSGTTCPSCPGDINGDGVVNIQDLLLLIDGWGPCP